MKANDAAVAADRHWFRQHRKVQQAWRFPYALEAAFLERVDARGLSPTLLAISRLPDEGRTRAGFTGGEVPAGADPTVYQTDRVLQRAMDAQQLGRARLERLGQAVPADLWGVETAVMASWMLEILCAAEANNLKPPRKLAVIDEYLRVVSAGLAPCEAVEAALARVRGEPVEYVLTGVPEAQMPPVH